MPTDLSLSYKLTIRYNHNYYIAKCISVIFSPTLAMKFLKGKKVATYTIGQGRKQEIIF